MKTPDGQIQMQMEACVLNFIILASFIEYNKLSVLYSDCNFASRKLASSAWNYTRLGTFLYYRAEWSVSENTFYCVSYNSPLGYKWDLHAQQRNISILHASTGPPGLPHIFLFSHIFRILSYSPFSLYPLNPERTPRWCCSHGNRERDRSLIAAMHSTNTRIFNP